MKLDSDDFELFDVPRRFEQDRAVLDARWRVLQAQVHPDRFMPEGASAQRVAMQWATRVNEAYERLKDPLKRAAYLCELNGAPVDMHDNAAMPKDFLMHQMAWREALEDARTANDVQALESEVSEHRRAALAELQVAVDERHDVVAAGNQVKALMFLERFAEDVDQRLEALEP